MHIIEKKKHIHFLYGRLGHHYTLLWYNCLFVEPHKYKKVSTFLFQSMCNFSMQKFYFFIKLREMNIND